MHNLIDFLLSFFAWFGKQNRTFKSLRENEDSRNKSTHFGVQSILFILIGFALSTAAFFGGAALLSVESILIIILGIIVMVVSGISVVVFFLYGLTSAIFQLRLNRKAIGFIGLFLCFAVTIGAAVLFLQIADNVL